MIGVLGERRGVGDLDGAGQDVDLDAQGGERRHRLVVEAGDRARLEGHGSLLAVGGAQGQDVVDEVELDLQAALAGVHQRRRQSAGRDVEGDLPPVIDRRFEGESHLADDLGPPMHGLAGVCPLGQRQFRPGA